MKKLIILLLISPFTYSQETQPELSLMGGYEHTSKDSKGWNVLFSAVSRTEKFPRLAFGFSLGYGISEFNREAGNLEISPDVGIHSSDYSLVSPVKRLHYARRERFRAGLETQYAVIDGERNKLYLGAGFALEILSNNQEHGYLYIQEVDSTGFTYTESPYWLKERGEEIDTRTLLLAQPFLAYQYGLSEKISLHVRAMANIALQDLAYPNPGPQLNLGVMYRL